MLDGWLGGLRERVGFGLGLGWMCLCVGRERSQLGCCGRLCILIASLDLRFGVVSWSGCAVVLWRFERFLGDVLRGRLGICRVKGRRLDKIIAVLHHH